MSSSSSSAAESSSDIRVESADEIRSRLKRQRLDELKQLRERRELQMVTHRAASEMISSEDDHTDEELLEPKSPAKKVLGKLNKAMKKGTKSVRGHLRKTGGGIKKVGGEIKKAFKSLKQIGKRRRSKSSDDGSSTTTDDESISNLPKIIRSKITKHPPTPSPLILDDGRAFFPDSPKKVLARETNIVEGTKKKKRIRYSGLSLIQLLTGLIFLIIAYETTYNFVEDTWQWDIDPFPLVPSVLYALGIVLIVNGMLFL
jgi:hypothetical protein